MFVCSQSATIKNLSPTEKDILSILSLHIGATLFSQFLEAFFPLIRSLTQHLVAPTFSPPLCSVLLILLPDYFGSDTQNGGGELRAGSHFLTDLGPGTDRVKTPYA